MNFFHKFLSLSFYFFVFSLADTSLCAAKNTKNAVLFVNDQKTTTSVTTPITSKSAKNSVTFIDDQKTVTSFAVPLATEKDKSKESLTPFVNDQKATMLGAIPLAAEDLKDSISLVKDQIKVTPVSIPPTISEYYEFYKENSRTKNVRDVLGNRIKKESWFTKIKRVVSANEKVFLLLGITVVPFIFLLYKYLTPEIETKLRIASLSCSSWVIGKFVEEIIGKLGSSLFG